MLLGDLFQAWVGLPAFETPEIRAVLATLGRLRERGMRIDYVEGNRDFFLERERLRRRLRRHRDRGRPAGGLRRILFVHGDGLNDRDYAVPLLALAVEAAPGSDGAWRAARCLGSRFVARTERRLGSTNFKHKRRVPTEAIRAYGARRFAEGHDLLVLGHFHEPLRLSGPGGEVRLLEAWFRRVPSSGSSVPPGRAAAGGQAAGQERPVTVLGSGTSTGVPVIGCACAVCTSTDPRDRRLRPGLKIELDGGVVLIDTPTDLREQALRFGLSRVDAVLFTHAHADHVFGLDDLRIFNFRQRAEIPCYGSLETLRGSATDLRLRLRGRPGGGRQAAARPAVRSRARSRSAGRRVVPMPVLHGELPVLGFRLGRLRLCHRCQPDPARESGAAARSRRLDPRGAALPPSPDPLLDRRGARRGGAAARRGARS